MNYPYNRQKFIKCCANEHVRHVSQLSDLRPLGPLVIVFYCFIYSEAQNWYKKGWLCGS